MVTFEMFCKAMGLDELGSKESLDFLRVNQRSVSSYLPKRKLVDKGSK